MAVQQKLFLLLITLATTIASKPAPNCSHPQVCGSLTIPYPFGTTPDCYLNEKFFISCDQTHTPPKPLLSRSNVTVLNISLDGELRVLGPIARACYNKFGKMTTNKTRISSMFSNSNFPISTRNKFTAVGCDTIGLIKFAKGKANIRTSCASYCDQETREVVNGSCSGVGCCQMPIIQEIWNYETEVQSVTNHSEIHDVNPCDYAFVVEEGSYNFSALDLKDNLKNKKGVPVLLDWAIVDKTCEKAKENVNTYACPAKNSQCVNSTNGHGYRCHCGHGYQGNPYLVDGCQDINECKYSHLNTCLTHLECVNTEGSYICKRGKKKPQLYLKLIIAISSALGAFLLLVVAWGLYKIIKKRIDDQRKERFFKRNGGLLLQQQLSSKEINVERVKLFNFEELEKSTDHFNANRILGQGGQGTVYKGMLADGKIVAIKKSKLENNEEGKIPECKLSEFINEVIILSQINHRNVVKLMGCCLESEVPHLVYEFILNGTLYQYIHDHQNEEFPLTWKVRLRISLEIGSALFYLHSAASFPIYHRDIKSSNILLDEKYRAKIADFGTSRSVHIEQTHLTTQVKGTFGYFDPEYFLSSQFTEKSDVYSFGVVMLELLTGQKPISRTRSKDGEESRSLTTYFLLCMEQNCLFDIVDPRIIEVGESQDQIIKVAHLAKRCLNFHGKNRPTMKEVAMELEEIQNSTKNFVNQQSFIERVGNEETKTTWDANPAPLWSSSFTTTAASLDALPILKTF